MNICVKCGQQFERGDEARNHLVCLRKIDEQGHTYLLYTGAAPDSETGAMALTKAMAELGKRHPNSKFRFLPYAYQPDKHLPERTILSAILAMRI